MVFSERYPIDFGKKINSVSSMNRLFINSSPNGPEDFNKP